MAKQDKFYRSELLEGIDFSTDLARARFGEEQIREESYFTAAH